MSKTFSWGGLTLALMLGAGAARAQTPIPPSPKDFAMAVSQSDQYEILAATVALVESQDGHVRTYAEAMIRDHMRLFQDLKQAVLASGLPPPTPGLSSDQASLLSSLQSARGHDFDKAYARQQTLVHTQALAVEESFATAGADPNLRKTAQSALPTIRDHLTMAKQLGVDVGGS